MTPADAVAAIERLVEAGAKATPGEWLNTKYCVITEGQLVAPNPGTRDEGDGIDSDDADFMCAAANARPALSALAGMCVLDVEVVRGLVAASGAALDDLGWEHCAQHGVGPDVVAAIAAADAELRRVEVRDA